MRWLLLMLLLFTTSAVAQVPSTANQYKRELTRVVQQEFGLQGNVAVHAAQIHQESAWRVDAKSHVGAEGFAQFMPKTAEWIVEVYPDLGPVAPYSPTWAFRSMARYNKWLNSRVKGHTECDKWWFTLRSYNGGLGHIQAESRNAVDPLDRHSVDAACGTARRSIRHCPENLGYPVRIIDVLEARYINTGWTGKETCPIVQEPEIILEIEPEVEEALEPEVEETRLSWVESFIRSFKTWFQQFKVAQ